MENTEAKINDLKSQYFKELINTISSVYVDIEMLQDFRFGALLSTLTVKEEMEYIYSKLPEYNKRLDLCTGKYFPVLGKSDEDLDAIIKNDPIKVTLLAPWTLIYNNFNVALTEIMHNNKAIQQKDRSLTVVVNHSDIDYPIELFDRFVKEMNRMHPKVTFKLSEQKRYEASPDFYSDFNMLFLYEHEKFFNNEKLLDSYTTKDKYMSKMIYTLPVINKDLDLDPSEYARALASTSATLNLFCDFFYMPGGIPLGK